MLELKSKNSSDHGKENSFIACLFSVHSFIVCYYSFMSCVSVYRLEEKEQEMKKEYAKLHERYTELFKTHMDYIDRTKILMGTGERLDGGRPRLPPLSLMNRYCFRDIL